MSPYAKAARALSGRRAGRQAVPLIRDEPPNREEQKRTRRAALLAAFDAEFSDLLLEGGDAAEKILTLFRRVGNADFGVLAFCDCGLAAVPPFCPDDAADHAEVRAAALKVAEEFARLPRTVALSRRPF